MRIYRPDADEGSRMLDDVSLLIGNVTNVTFMFLFAGAFRKYQN